MNAERIASSARLSACSAMNLTEQRPFRRVTVAIGLADLVGVDTSHWFRLTGEKRVYSMTSPFPLFRCCGAFVAVSQNVSFAMMIRCIRHHITCLF
jgi:hypothetical protein